MHSKKINLMDYASKVKHAARDIAKMNLSAINRELDRVDNARITDAHKRLVKGTVYSKLSNNKRRKLWSHFGAPVSPAVASAATNIAATQVNQQQQAMQQQQQQQAVQQQAVQQQAAQQQQQRQPLIGSVQSGNYQQAASAIDNAKHALLQAGQELVATQGISGFGRSYR